MPAINWKTGTFFVSTLTGSIFGIKGLVTKNNPIAPPANSGIDLNSSSDNLLDKDLYKVEDNYTKTPSIQETKSLDPRTYQSKITDPWDVKEYPEDIENWVWDVKYTEEEKQKNREEADRIYKILNDYSFKLWMPCGWGTGWILDYQLPDEEEEYPTTWYIATDAHVIWRLSFSENPYKQALPNGTSWTQYLRSKDTKLYENLKNYQGSVRDNCWAVDKYGYIDINISQQETGRERKANVGGIALKEMEEPKLFYAAFNYLDDSQEVYKKNHFADFAVLEIKFTSPEAAKRATNDFATKYKQRPQDALDMFGKPLEEKYDSPEKLWNAKDNYYILAYPKGAKDEWAYTTNWNRVTTFAATLDGNGLSWNQQQDKKQYKGFDNAEEVSSWGKEVRDFKWNGEVYGEVGQYIRFAKNPMIGGSSGGLYVDGKGNAIGVNVQVGWHNNWVQPLRSSGIVEIKKGDKKIKTPKFDLILGSKGQRNSYKQQVQEYILKKNKKTWLSKRGNWTIDNQNLGK